MGEDLWIVPHTVFRENVIGHPMVKVDGAAVGCVRLSARGVTVYTYSINILQIYNSVSN